MTTLKNKRLTVAAAAIVVSSILASCGDSTGGTGSDYSPGANQPLNNPTQSQASNPSSSQNTGSQASASQQDSNTYHSGNTAVNAPSGTANIASDSSSKAVTAPDPIKRIGAVNRFTTFDPTSNVGDDTHFQSSNGQHASGTSYGTGTYNMGGVSFTNPTKPEAPHYADPNTVHTTNGNQDHDSLDTNPNQPFSENSYFGSSCLHGDYYLSVLAGQCENFSRIVNPNSYEKSIVAVKHSNPYRQNLFYTTEFTDYHPYNDLLTYNLNSGINPFDSRVTNGSISFAQQQEFLNHFTEVEDGRFPVNLLFLTGSGFFQPFSGLGIPTTNIISLNNDSDLVAPGRAHDLYSEYLEHRSKNDLPEFFTNYNNNLNMPFTGKGYRVAIIDGNTDFDKLSKFYNNKPITVDLSSLNNGDYGIEQAHPFQTSVVITGHRSRTGIGIVPDAQLYASRISFFDHKTATAQQKAIEAYEFNNIDKLFIQTYDAAKPVVINNSFGYSFANPQTESDENFFKKSAATYIKGFKYLSNLGDKAPLLVFSSGNYSPESYAKYQKTIGIKNFNDLTNEQKFDYYEYYSGVQAPENATDPTALNSDRAIANREKLISLKLNSGSFLGVVSQDPDATKNLIVVTGGYYNYGSNAIRNYDDSLRKEFLKTLLEGTDVGDRTARMNPSNDSGSNTDNIEVSNKSEATIPSTFDPNYQDSSSSQAQDDNSDNSTIQADQQDDLDQVNSESTVVDSKPDSKSDKSENSSQAQAGNSENSNLDNIAKHIGESIATKSPAASPSKKFSSSNGESNQGFENISHNQALGFNPVEDKPRFHKIEQPGHHYYYRPYLFAQGHAPAQELGLNAQEVAQQTLSILASPSNPLSHMRTTAENIELMSHGVIDTSTPPKASSQTTQATPSLAGKPLPTPQLAGSDSQYTPTKGLSEDKEITLRDQNYDLKNFENSRYIQAFGAFACGVTKYDCITAPFMVEVPSLDDPKYKSEVTWGTSFSAPIVSGAAIMVKQQFPWFTAKNIKTTLLTTAFDAGDKGIDDYFGWGFLNVAGALRGPGMFAFGDFVANLSNRELSPSNANTHYASYFTNNIFGTGGLIVNSESTKDQLYLTGDNHYQGDTVVNGGTLILASPQSLNLINYGFSTNQNARIDSKNTFVNYRGQFIINDGYTRNIFNNGKLSLAKATIYGDLVLSPYSELTVNQSTLPDASRVTNGVLADGNLTVLINSGITSNGYLATDQVHVNKLLLANTIQGNFQNVKVVAKSTDSASNEAFNLSISDPKLKVVALTDAEQQQANSETPVYTTYKDTNSIQTERSKLQYVTIQYKPNYKVALEVEYRVANPSSSTISSLSPTSGTDASLFSLVDPTINRLFAKANSIVRTAKADSANSSSSSSSSANNNNTQLASAESTTSSPALQSVDLSAVKLNSSTAQTAPKQAQEQKLNQNQTKDQTASTQPALSLASSQAQPDLKLGLPNPLDDSKLSDTSVVKAASDSKAQSQAPQANTKPQAQPAVVLASADSQDNPVVQTASIIQHMNDKQLRQFYFANSGSVFADLQLANNAQSMQTSLAFGKVVNGRLIGTQEYQTYVVPEYHAYLNYNYTNIDWHNDDSLIHGKHVGQGITAGVYGFFGDQAYGVAAYVNQSDWHENLAKDYNNKTNPDKETSLANGSVSTTGLTASYAYSSAASKFSVTGYFNYQTYDLSRTSLFRFDQTASFTNVQAGLHADYSYRIYGDSYSGIVLTGGATLDNSFQSRFNEIARPSVNNLGVAADNQQRISYSQTLSMNVKSSNHVNGFLGLGANYYNNFRLFGYGHHLDLGVNLDKSIFGNNYAIKTADGKTLTGQVFNNDFLLHSDARYSLDLNNNINIGLKASYDYSSNWSNKQLDVSLDFIL